MQKLRLSKPLFFLVLINLISAIALGTTIVTRNLTNTVNITGSQDFQIYSDSTATIPVTSLTWDIPKGSSLTKHIYLKNIGDIKLIIGWSLTANTLPTGYTLSLTWNGVVWTSGSGKDANVGTTIHEIDITLTVPTVGSYSFTISFTGDT
jgi:hypothetical protein